MGECVPKQEVSRYVTVNIVSPNKVAYAVAVYDSHHKAIDAFFDVYKRYIARKYISITRVDPKNMIEWYDITKNAKKKRKAVDAVRDLENASNLTEKLIFYRMVADRLVEYLGELMAKGSNSKLSKDIYIVDDPYLKRKLVELKTDHPELRIDKIYVVVPELEKRDGRKVITFKMYDGESNKRLLPVEEKKEGIILQHLQ